MADADRSPLGDLGALAVQEVREAPDLLHFEIYTPTGLLDLLWHGPVEAEGVAVAGGGALGGTLGPADGLYVDLGRHLSQRGFGLLRVGYRAPNDLERCTHDLLAAADLASRQGARRVVTVGHSFGGAVAIQAGAALARECVGVVALSTQTGGAEAAEEMSAPLLLVHGDADTVLPVQASELVQMISGGELHRLAGADHLLRPAQAEVRSIVVPWVTDRLAITG